MKVLLVSTAFLLVAFMPDALALKCKVCGSTESWDACDKKAKSTDCPSGLDRCMNVYTKVGSVEGFSKSCGSEAFCNQDKNPTCKALKGSDIECKIDCCDKNDCNTGSSVMVSGVLLMVCALLGMAFLSG